MPSVEAVIRNNPSYPINNAGAHQQIVTDLFYSFCNLAQNNWKYGASAAGVNTDMILASDSMQQWQLNCMRISGLFVEVVRRYFSQVLAVDPFPLAINNQECNPRNFITPAGLQCFDASIVGNVITADRSAAQVNRCLFSEHWFVRIGATYYDPTFCTIHADANSIVGCQLDGAPTTYYTRGPKSRALVKIVSFGSADSQGKFYTGTEGGVQYVFEKTDARSAGFSETFLMKRRDTLSDEIKQRMGLA